MFEVLWSSNTAIGKSLVLVIGFAAIYAALCAVRHRRRYLGFETAHLFAVERTLKEAQKSVPESEPQPDSGPQITPTVSLDSLRQSASPRSIIGDRLEMLAQLRAAKVKVSVAALQQISLAHESARATLRFPGFAVGLLMLVGLLGTFIGIAMMLQNFGDFSKVEEVILHLNQVLDGMKTKFSTTLAGLLGAIVVSLLNFRLAQAQSQFFEKLDRFTNVHLLPATIPAVEDETLMEEVSRQLETGFSRLDGLAKQNLETAAEIRAIQSGYAGMVEDLKQTIRSENPERIQTVIGKISDVMEQLVVMNTSVRQMVSSMPEMMTGTNTALRELVKTLPAAVRQAQVAPAQNATRQPGAWPLYIKLAVGALLSAFVVMVVMRLLQG